jgi:thiol-disulfide isomerase/thioredoxin
VLVDFWASWCAPCRESMPVLEKLSKSYKEKGFVVLGVNIDNDAEAARKFLKDLPVSFQVVCDAQKQVAKAYAPPTMPSSYLIDRQGKVHVHAFASVGIGRTSSDVLLARGPARFGVLLPRGPTRSDELGRGSALIGAHSHAGLVCG